ADWATVIPIDVNRSRSRSLRGLNCWWAFVPGAYAPGFMLSRASRADFVPLVLFTGRFHFILCPLIVGSEETMNLETLKTPSLVLDIAKVRRNAERMSQRVKQFGADLRPHIKTHKCIEVARMQTAGRSGAVTVSTLAEARAFAANGFAKITYAVPI